MRQEAKRSKIAEVFLRKKRHALKHWIKTDYGILNDSFRQPVGAHRELRTKFVHRGNPSRPSASLRPAGRPVSLRRPRRRRPRRRRRVDSDRRVPRQPHPQFRPQKGQSDRAVWRGPFSVAAPSLPAANDPLTADLAKGERFLRAHAVAEATLAPVYIREITHRAKTDDGAAVAHRVGDHFTQAIGLKSSEIAGGLAGAAHAPHCSARVWRSWPAAAISSAPSRRGERRHDRQGHAR